ncbi:MULTISPECIES: type II toxin-antitoxin system HipA family toxin [unclassified Alcanivorax]|jgi:serine/threonine-protein kinase HipA|uniref:type II toxin-antitoxin system HipA family toxin n=3 Tax=Alcanivorax TaxID=59753 RepID=UPI0007B85571|nr:MULTISPECIES: type II toxin-antitoxin system HipA family toxin [unclassified Alcanivorax]KZX74865.1 phosphatidylinositol kinase [Alcanivorax sp. HI0013]KZX76273.1 phosphatidylinositol kinase [Alcanivorax sp. HI0011]KZY13303.1 phosphatidylinositol kinase [Alcanivorax sp. HI0035]MED5239018.1 type II toxin-antitoxin system HipA family toxin [Pseudomonadota bacterium]KZX60766.1 phosphatidylinositol kinase [Alcanivorax sp. HI0003]
MTFKPVRKLTVTRTLATGQAVTVGVLAQNRQGVFFQYDADYLGRFGNLSPFGLKATTELQLAPKRPHSGLHGLFGDSLPDGWGSLLQDRVFRQHGILPAQITAMDRLAFVGASGMGALSFSPTSEYRLASTGDIDLAKLGLEAQAFFDGQTEEVLADLVAAGSSGGARPKAQFYISPDEPDRCRTVARPGDEAWLVKFTSRNLPLGHEEGLCEAVYLHLAGKLGLEPPEWRLFEAPEQSGARAWLGVKRFDWVSHPQKAGRLHMHSACGLLDADFRTPSLDYEDLLKASRHLCRSPAVGKLQFRRAMFNLFACNQDDHSKNWAFLQDDAGEWVPAPFYDVTFSPHPYQEHATAYAGFGKNPPLKAIQGLAARAGYAKWELARKDIDGIVDALADFAAVARDFGVDRGTAELIGRQLDELRKVYGVSR